MKIWYVSENVFNNIKSILIATSENLDQFIATTIGHLSNSELVLMQPMCSLEAQTSHRRFYDISFIWYDLAHRKFQQQTINYNGFRKIFLVGSILDRDSRIFIMRKFIDDTFHSYAIRNMCFLGYRIYACFCNS